MRIGTAVRDITPPPGAELGGFLYRVQPSVGVHDALFARAVYVEHDAERLLWLHADLIGFENAFVIALRHWAVRRFGLDDRQIVVSTTHTHSGPATVALIGCGAMDPDYLARLREHLEHAAAAAVAQTEPVALAYAEGHCDLATDRRRTASAHVDPRVGVVGFRRRDGSFAAVVANYAMHNVALGHANRYVSGDVAGRAARTLTELLPGRPSVLFTAGAAGNVNPPRTGVDAAQSDAWGDALAESVHAAITSAVSDPAPILSSARLAIPVPLVAADATWVHTAADHALAAVAGHADEQARRYRDAVDVWCRIQLDAVQEGRSATSIPVELQLVGLGSTRYLCVNAEIFSRLSDDLRAATGNPRVYVVGYANGLIGYVPTEAAFDEGGYEVDSAFLFYGGLPVRRGAFEAIRDRTVELIRSARVEALAGSIA